MSANYPDLPLGGSALLRVFASVLAVVTHWLKEFARARRHRREARRCWPVSIAACSPISASPARM